ncbi:hypothetical protein [Burkholderia gladioli]|uniref:hypothetical protein n=1 Tax=Burkholderia gladioli TaxID=28095 RepID=UPI001904F5AE|nr:hypothetical protein [Burkholderia gladioli]MBJ9675236.1 hypothetical protein [Burkholderia gladioli]MDN7463488.1 hypothetical protein [Burkholderia gladioli]
MEAEHKKALGIDDTMTVVQTGSKNQSRKGQDTDITSYDVFDSGGALIATCEVHESMSIYPPHGKHTSYNKWDADGKRLI